MISIGPTSALFFGVYVLQKTQYNLTFYIRFLTARKLTKK